MTSSVDGAQNVGECIFTGAELCSGIEAVDNDLYMFLALK